MEWNDEIQRQAAELKNKSHLALTNAEKRVLYADTELLVLKLNGLLRKHVNDPELLKLRDELSSVSSSLTLNYVYRTSSGIMRALSRVDQLLRMVAVWLMLALASIFFAIPCILLQPLDYLLVSCGIVSVYTQISVVCKLFLSRTILRVSGIHTVIEGAEKSHFGKECVLACFSHASSMDGFLVTSAIPVTALTVCKAEVFLIPYFSWCASAFGGVPINRDNREQAAKAMEAAAAAAQLGECMAISPEGTRSLSGQLLEFKKGPFYLWEQLQTPIIPIITMGAYELFPPGYNMTLPGKVYVRFLAPIMPHEAHTKEEMCTLLRTRMLEGLRDVPDDVACELTWRQRIVCWLNVAAVYAIVYHLYKAIVHYDVMQNWQMSYAQLWMIFAAVSVMLTFVFYVYAVYCAPVVRGCIASKVTRKHLSAV